MKVMYQAQEAESWEWRARVLRTGHLHVLLDIVAAAAAQGAACQILPTCNSSSQSLKQSIATRMDSSPWQIACTPCMRDDKASVMR